MNRIDELKKEVMTSKDEFFWTHIGVLRYIDRAVEIADLQNAEKIAELERMHEAEIEKAVKGERERIIGVIKGYILTHEEEAKSLYPDSDEEIKERLIIRSTLHLLYSILSTPKQEAK